MKVRLNEMVRVEVKEEAVQKFPFPNASTFIGFIRFKGKIIPIAMTEHSLLHKNWLGFYPSQTIDLFKCGIKIEEYRRSFKTQLIVSFDDRIQRINFPASVFSKAQASASFLLQNDVLVEKPKLRLIDKIRSFFVR